MSSLATGSQTWLYLSDRLVEFPLGLFGVAIGTVILPHLSRRHAATDAEGYGAALDWGLRLALLAGVPAALGLLLLAEPLTAVVYQGGKFTGHDTRMAAISLSAMSLGIPAFMLSKVLSPAFYARQDTRTPMRAAILTVIANVVLTIALTTPLWLNKVPGAHGGIALATGLAGIFNAWLLWRYLKRAGLLRPQPGWGRYWLRLGVACATMAASSTKSGLDLRPKPPPSSSTLTLTFSGLSLRRAATASRAATGFWIEVQTSARLPWICTVATGGSIDAWARCGT